MRGTDAHLLAGGPAVVGRRAKPDLGRWAQLFASLLVGGAVMGLFLLVIGDVEQEASNLAALLPLGYAFGAGMVATVNPCGFVMLPAFVGYYIAADETAGRPAHGAAGALLRGGKLVVAVTAGFVLIFSAVGFVVSMGARALAQIFPVAGLLVGVGLAVLGAWLLIRGTGFGIAAASRVHRPLGGTFWSLFPFGLAYGVASLACTLPVFLAVVGSVLSTEGWLQGLAVFTSYALGMGALLATVVLGAALFRNAVGSFLRRLLPYVHRVSAALLLGAGVYLVYYWGGHVVG
ncbi:MAG: cytochrome c biogenesis protein CcdA [Chloroflexota bacterium]|nr:cytochrome c biogenesis protein CcdA [Chloroflexota bacterium]